MEAGVAQRPLRRLAQAWSELTARVWTLFSEATQILDWFLRKRGPPPRCAPWSLALTALALCMSAADDAACRSFYQTVPRMRLFMSQQHMHVHAC